MWPPVLSWKGLHHSVTMEGGKRFPCLDDDEQDGNACLQGVFKNICHSCGKFVAKNTQ